MRMINADVLKQHIDKLPALPDGNFAGNHSALKALINMQPTVDAVPVVHGRWIYHVDDLFPADNTQECDQCHEEQPLTCDDNFCPHCGAKMDGKDGDT